jgi:hypothetical protein
MMAEDMVGKSIKDTNAVKVKHKMTQEQLQKGWLLL